MGRRSLVPIPERKKEKIWRSFGASQRSTPIKENDVGKLLLPFVCRVSVGEKEKKIVAVLLRRCQHFGVGRWVGEREREK